MFIGQCIQDFTIAHGLVMSLFLAGLVGGATHCAGMCSPFVLAQGTLKKSGRSLLLPYHLGRMTTYVTLGILVNSVLSLAFVYSDFKPLIAAPMLMLAGILFLVSTFPTIAALFPWAGKIQFSAPIQFVSKLAGPLMVSENPLKKYLLGIILGFIPCGLVTSALLVAATAKDIGEAALAMSAFAVGTMPVLMLIGLGGQTIKKRYPTALRYFSQTAMVISSLWLFVLASNMLL
jgi:sulfite exporter TauE/SafE